MFQTEKKANDTEESSKKQTNSTSTSSSPSPVLSLDKEVLALNARLQNENSNLHRINTSLHKENHFLSLKHAQFEERITAEETKNEELQNKVDDLEYELTKCRMRNGKLETTLAETQVMRYIIKQFAIDLVILIFFISGKA